MFKLNFKKFEVFIVVFSLKRLSCSLNEFSIFHSSSGRGGFLEQEGEPEETEADEGGGEGEGGSETCVE